MATISKIKNGSINYQIVGSPRYAICSTSSNAIAKVASLVDNSSVITLETGVRICVKFTNENTVASPTLNIGDTGAKDIYWHGVTLESNQYWQAGAVLDFVYNGTQWELVGIAKTIDVDHTHNYIIEQNKGLMQKFWRGSAEELPAEENRSDDTMYIVTDGEDESAVVASGDMKASVYDPQGKSTDIFAYVDIRVPAWTSADEGKFLRIVNGTPAWVSVQNAEEVSF